VFLVELGDEAVLAEDLFVVFFGDPDKIVEFGLDLRVPVIANNSPPWQSISLILLNNTPIISGKQGVKRLSEVRDQAPEEVFHL